MKASLIQVPFLLFVFGCSSPSVDTPFDKAQLVKDGYKPWQMQNVFHKANADTVFIVGLSDKGLVTQKSVFVPRNDMDSLAIGLFDEKKFLRLETCENDSTKVYAFNPVLRNLYRVYYRKSKIEFNQINPQISVGNEW